MNLGKRYHSRGNAEKVRVEIAPNNGVNGTPGHNKLLTINLTGEYIVRTKFSALRPAGSIASRLRLHVVDREPLRRRVLSPTSTPF